ncbi:hypothetical protein GIW70_12630 [Pseudomonas syringae]|nr:hypothetical protein [Pseudomonas syringae]MCF5069031.1 hypothetical protein [Pseudomonas syringae]
MTRTSHTLDLAPPVLAQSFKGAINLAAAAHVLVDVAPFSGMDAGDLIELYWDDCYVASHVLTTEEVGVAVSLRVPESFIVSGSSTFHYRLMQVGQAPAVSATTRVEVKLDCPGGQPSTLGDDENQQLAPVSLPDTIRRKGVNPGQIRRGLPLSIEPYPNMAEDDEITLRWGDVRMDLPRLTADDIGRRIQVWVPSSVIVEAGEDLRLDVSYCVIDRVGNNSRWAPPRTLKIGCANAFLTVPLK